jgi:hypothetical protein
VPTDPQWLTDLLSEYDPDVARCGKPANGVCVRHQGHPGPCSHTITPVGVEHVRALASAIALRDAEVAHLRELTELQNRRFHDDQRRAREAGVTFEAVRGILSAYDNDDEDGISFGRMVEALRDLALGAASRMAADTDAVRVERAATATLFRSMWASLLATAVERGDHLNLVDGEEP